MLGDKIGEVFSQKEESNVSTREINETKKTISDILSWNPFYPRFFIFKVIQKYSKFYIYSLTLNRN